MCVHHCILGLSVTSQVQMIPGNAALQEQIQSRDRRALYIFQLYGLCRLGPPVFKQCNCFRCIINTMLISMTHPVTFLHHNALLHLYYLMNSYKMAKLFSPKSIMDTDTLLGKIFLSWCGSTKHRRKKITNLWPWKLLHSFALLGKPSVAESYTEPLKVPQMKNIKNLMPDATCSFLIV